MKYTSQLKKLNLRITRVEIAVYILLSVNGIKAIPIISALLN